MSDQVECCDQSYDGPDATREGYGEQHEIPEHLIRALDACEVFVTCFSH